MVTNNKGFTLLEILITVLILALVMSGFANLFYSSKWYVIHSRSWMVAGELARYYLDPLQANVSQDNWTNSCLGNQSCSGEILQLSQLIPGAYSYNYTPSYNISNGPIGNLTKVVLNITWNEIAP